MEVLSKLECYEKYNLGLFGNKPLRWDSWEDVKKSFYRGLICIRGIGIPREKVRYNVLFDEVEKVIGEYAESGISSSILRFNQSMPDEKLTIQGEIRRGLFGFDLTYTDVKKPMNLALKEREVHVRGLVALNLLKSFLFPSSFADLEVLFELYPDSVVEFSSYSCMVGDVPGRNTVIWEVRNY